MFKGVFVLSNQCFKAVSGTSEEPEFSSRKSNSSSKRSDIYSSRKSSDRRSSDSDSVKSGFSDSSRRFSKTKSNAILPAEPLEKVIEVSESASDFSKTPVNTSVEKSVGVLPKLSE